MAQKVSKTTTDHETIRSWAEERGGLPAEVESTAREGQDRHHPDRLPRLLGRGELRRISWDEWFQKFDEAGLALRVRGADPGRPALELQQARRPRDGRRRAPGDARTSRRSGERAAGGGSARTRSAAAGGARGSRAAARAPSRGAGGARKGSARSASRKGSPSTAAGGQRKASRAEAARTTRTRRGGTRGKAPRKARGGKATGRSGRRGGARPSR